MSAARRESARVFSRNAAVLAAVVLIATPASARPTVGIAYDSVTKLVPSSDPPLRPDDFATDFRAARQPSQDCEPSLLRRYVTIHKERIDEVCKQEATIVDCDARTATMLDFANKTYGTVSLDAKYDDRFPNITGDGMTSKITIERAALGSKNVGGVLTDEYTASYEQSFVSPVLSVTSIDRSRYYLAATPLPELACIDVAAPWLSRYGTPQRYEPELQRYFKARTSKMLGSHFSAIERGPELPSWRIVRYSVRQRFQRQSGVADSDYFFELQSGNIRSIDDDDPAFRLPSGFTKIPT